MDRHAWTRGRLVGGGGATATVLAIATLLVGPTLSLPAVAKGGGDRLDFSKKELRVRFSDPPKAGLLFDARSGRVLWSRKPQAERPIASLTKLMTALVAVDELNPKEKVRISKNAERTPPVEIGLEAGARVPAERLLAAALIPSANDAAVALAEGAEGGVKPFVRAMNDRARKLDLGCTDFNSPNGLSSGDRSCPVDLAELARKALGEKRIADLAGKRDDRLRIPGRGKITVTNTNPLLRDGYRGTIGLKTGFTRAAGRCLVAVVERDGRRLVAILLGSPDTGVQAEKLFDKAF